MLPYSCLRCLLINLYVLCIFPFSHCLRSPTLLKEFQRLSNFQIECDVFITLSELRNPSSCVVVLLDLLSPCIDLLHGNSLIFVDSSVKEKLRSIIASAKHWCAILSDTPSNLWSRSIGMIASQVAETTENHSSLLLLDASGVFDDRSGHSFHSVISVALTLTGRAVSEACKLSKSISFMSNDAGLSSTLTAMKSIAQASLILRNHIILYCPPSMLPSSMTLANMTEFVCDVSTRADLGRLIELSCDFMCPLLTKKPSIFASRQGLAKSSRHISAFYKPGAEKTMTIS